MIANYVTSLLGGSVETAKDGSGNIYVKVYNGTGSALANGLWKALTYDLTTAYEVRAVPVNVAEEATETVIVGVINNVLSGKNTIPNGEYGWLQISGWCPYASTTGTIHEGDQLKIYAATTAALDQGADDAAQLASDTVGIAVKLVTTDVWQVWVVGKQSVVAAAP